MPPARRATIGEPGCITIAVTESEDHGRGTVIPGPDRTFNAIIEVVPGIGSVDRTGRKQLGNMAQQTHPWEIVRHQVSGATGASVALPFIRSKELPSPVYPLPRYRQSGIGLMPTPIP